MLGEVIDVGKNVSEFKMGDRVASNGPHAEIVAVPKNLAAKIPENVSDEESSIYSYFVDCTTRDKIIKS